MQLLELTVALFPLAVTHQSAKFGDHRIADGVQHGVAFTTASYKAQHLIAHRASNHDFPTLLYVHIAMPLSSG